MVKQLENLRWEPMWVSFIGCLQGCLKHLGLSLSNAWLFGATGHAFVLNVHKEVCASGPTAWDGKMLFKLSANVGAVIEGVHGSKAENDFEAKKKRAWELAQSAINQGLSCFGWELEAPEYYVVYGYDDTGYYFSGPQCDQGKGPMLWQKLASGDIGMLEMNAVKKGRSAEAVKVVKDALQFALDHAKGDQWILPDYKSGPAGFQAWINAVQQKKADGFGMAYNCAVWAECRVMAAAFLKEAKERLNGKAGPEMEEAIQHYQAVAQNLTALTKLFPFPGKEGPIVDEKLCKAAVDGLQVAKGAEEKGLDTLKKIVGVL